MKNIEELVQQTKFNNEAHKLRVNLLHTASWLKAEIGDFLKPLGITQPQFNILRILRGVCPEAISTLQIREKMIDKMSDTSRMVDRLVKKGWVKKVPCTNDNLNKEEAQLFNKLLNKLRKD